MIGLVAPTILNRPRLLRGNEESTKKDDIRYHLQQLPYMIRKVSDGLRIKSCEFKWCKLVLMRNRIPMDVFHCIQPFLIVKRKQDYYKNSELSLSQLVSEKKYLHIEAKIYQLGFVSSTKQFLVRAYLHDKFGMNPESQRYLQTIPFRDIPKFVDFVNTIYYFTDKNPEYTNDELTKLIEYWI